MTDHLHRALTHTIEIAAPVERVFPMFTPEGERVWVPNWAPRFVPASAEPSRPGSVFWTDHDGENTVWMVVGLDQNDRRARYVRHTPGSRIAMVDVVCATGGAGTRVTVSYDVTGLSDDGDRAIRAMEGGFAAAISDWKVRVETALTR
jgi:hypothetical protein